MILTEFHESARVDRQLFGRSARQGNAGTVQAIACTADELFTRFAWPASGWLQRRYAAQSKSLPQWLIRALTRWAQSRAERHNRRTRLQTIQQDRKRMEMMGFSGNQG